MAVADGTWAGGTANEALGLARYATDGSFEFFRFLTPVNVYVNPLNSITLIPLQDSGVLVVLPEQLGDFPECVVSRFTSDGTLQWSGFTYKTCEILAADPTGAIVLDNGSEPANLAADGAENDKIFAQTPYVPAVSVSPLPSGKGVAFDPESYGEGFSGSDGSTYLLTTSVSQENTLTKLSPQAAVLWQRDFENTVSYFNVSDDRICLSFASDSTAITCYSSSDDTALASIDLGDKTLLGERFLDDDEILTLTAGQSDTTLHATLFSPDGSIASDTDLAYTLPSIGLTKLIGRSGVILLIDSELSTVHAFDKHGVLLYSIDLPTLTDFQLTNIVGEYDPAPDGTLLLTGYFETAGADKTLIISPTGKLVATVDEIDSATFKDGVAYALSITPTDTLTRVREISLSTGSSLTDVMLAQGYYNMYVDESTALVVSITDQVRVFDPGTGALLHDVRPDCGTEPCRYDPGVLLSADGTVRLVQTVTDDVYDSVVRVTAFQESPALPSIRVDQPALGGAWYVPSSSGQGFTFDYLPSASLFFVAWFTYDYDRPSLNDPSDLVWVTMQGEVSPGAKQLDMTLARTDPGIFNSGIVTAHEVGTARITFTDCNNGLLDFQFDTADFYGVEGTSIPIVRISPTTAPCMLADGTTTAPQNGSAPSNGFDARQSGSWFDPATSGQGLELTVVPAGEGSKGLLFGAWFTFDPPPANDPSHEHWFTLQGDLSAASNGTVSLPILQTFGSSLLGPPTHNTHQVGTATLTLTGCDTGTLVYSFDTSDVAHDFAGLSGSIALQKIGGCSPPRD